MAHKGDLKADFKNLAIIKKSYSYFINYDQWSFFLYKLTI